MNLISPNQEAELTTLTLLLRQIRFEAVGINSYEFVDPAGAELPTFTAGSHIDVHLGGGVVRQYSLCNPPSERHHYVIAVLKEEAGRGGSRRLHETLRVQDRVEISVPRNNFALVVNGKHHILIGGGIGITPLKAMAHELDEAGIHFELHYCAKGPEYTAFNEEITALKKDSRVMYHFDGVDPSKRLDVVNLLRHYTHGTHVYYCGPGGFMAACAAAAEHWPSGTVHSEHFKAPEQLNRPTDDVATTCVQIASTGQKLEIPPSRSVAEVLNEAGIEVPTSCVSGLCGTCKLRYLEGEIDQGDYILSEDEKTEYFTACVSRPKSGTVVLHL
jgi:vanillate O-demethylase ferredoxin subunit